MKEKQLKKLFIIFAILVLAALAIFVLWPIMIPIISGFILAYLFYPLYIRILKLVREKNISALIIILLIVFIIFIPLWFLFPIISRQLIEAYDYIQKINIAGVLKIILPESISTDTIVMINNFISKLANSIFSKSSDLIFNIPSLFLKIGVSLFVFFFAMRDGEKLKEYIKGASPFPKDIEANLEHQFKEITKSVVYGNIVVGLIQGILAGIGLFIFQVPNALLLSLLAILFAILPIIGAWLVWIPASIYLVVSGHTGLAIGLFIYSATIVSFIDNVLRSYIVARKTKLNSGIVLVGMIGGLIVFGVLGLILGPLILSYLLIVLEAYKNKKFSKLFG